MRAMFRTQEEVMFGQHLDLVRSADVLTMHHLKTGSYTVRGPLRLGALLAGAGKGELDTLERFGAPIGVAFQIRDDLLGVLGDPAVTGKPRGNDLYGHKRTAVAQEAEESLSPSAHETLTALVSNDEIEDAIELLEESGVFARLEGRIATLTDEAKRLLVTSDLPASGKDLLSSLIALLVHRES
jgi:geranylgeranyl diphosphate synthase type I